MSFMDNDSSRESKYNSGWLQTERNNETLKLLESVRLNGIAFNETHQNFNYVLHFECVKILYANYKTKFSAEERKKGDRIRDVMQKYISAYPIWVEPKSKGFVGGNKPKLDKKTWDKIRRGIEMFEEFVRDTADKHQFFSPDKKDPRKAILEQ